MISAEHCIAIGEYAAAGLYEEPDRSLFYRTALGIRRYFEHCPLAVYRGEALYPSGTLPRSGHIRPGYSGMYCDANALRDRGEDALADAYAQEFGRFRSSVPPEHTVAGDMWTHSMPHYERVLREGLSAYLPRIEAIADRDMREGLLHLLAGIRCYRDRSLEYLRSVDADERLICALEKVPFEPAGDIYEAVEGWNFILYLDFCDNLGCVASGLLPYYHGEDITDLLRNLFDNLDSNDGYSMSLSTDYTPLTLQCLAASKGKRRPMIELFVDETTPDEVWEKAFEVVRSGNGQPAFYSAKTLLPGLARRFPDIRAEDLKQFCGGGCTESMLAGLSHVGSLDAGVNLLLLLERVLYDKLPTATSFEEFYDAYLAAVREAVDRVTAGIAESQKNRAKYVANPMRTLLTDDCIDKGRDFNNGGARYQWSIINFAGMINVIDSLLVIRDYVFGTPACPAEEFLGYLRANDPEFLARARKHSVCFGKDNADANRLSTKLSTEIYAMLDDKKPYFGSGFLPASIQFRSHADAGRHIGATPDGREAGAPLCDSLAAIFGKDTAGPTALLKSTTSLNLARALGTPVLNFNIEPDFKSEILKALIQGYMALGGIQIQLTCTSPEMLREAYEHPDLHRNLIVRVGGYSEYFCRLTDEMKRMILQRSIQKSVS